MNMKFMKTNRFNKVRIFCFALMLAMMMCMIVYAANQSSVKEHLKNSENWVNIKDKGAVGDGITDDTEVIQKTLDEAKKTQQTVYFPEGTYLITSTVTLEYGLSNQIVIQGESAEKTKIVGSESLSGAVIKSSMYGGFSIKNIGMEHRGEGNCLDSWFLIAERCSFTSVESNNSDLVVFTGSNCRITECTFEGKNAEVYALRHTKYPDSNGYSGIAINSFIIDNLFKGSSKGVLVNSEEDGNRIEGLKINGNTFTNSGIEQITVETILHIDISNNTMSGSSGSAIVMNPKGLLVDGMFVCSNDIQSAVACIYEAEGSAFSTRINFSDNVFHDSAYGIWSKARIGTLTIGNNVMTDITTAGIALSQIDELILTENSIQVKDGGNTVRITSSDAKTIITNNTFNKEMNNTLKGGESVIKSNTVK